MTDAQNPKPDWYPDPLGRHEHRYWDGSQWTEHVASHGRQSVDPPTGNPKTVAGSQTPDKVQDQVARHAQQAHNRGGSAVPQFQGDGTIFGEPILVVNQKAKLIEVNNEYAIFDQAGTQIGAVRQVGQSKAKKVLRVVASVDQFMTHKLQVIDRSGGVVLQVTRPAKVMKSRVIVQDGMGNEIGQVVQENMIGKIRFAYEVNGQRIGGIQAENWRAWNFSLQDAGGSEVARITKTFEGVAKTLFTTADNYVLQVHRPLDDPLRSLVVASALTVDTALKQDSRGFG
ncbi:MAG: DUF2510 domain-containing protein [Actinomycetia bacterium]|nr:DUF2510 domain-containing protein [Actinomycetes bacterium]MCP4957959.1 DUF2510 domain-containing protein [Actinomycetes bacterium]